MTGRIIGTGSFLAKNRVTNDDLSKIMDTSDEWIYSRTGIKERPIAKEETTTYLATMAAKAALADANVTPEELDLIIVATVTNDYVTPACACAVQAELGAMQAQAFDINAACSGFMYSLHTVYAYMKAGLAKRALIIGAETLSRIMDWSDRSTCVLFGDGAGAVVVEAAETGILACDQGADGVRGKNLTCMNRTNNNPLVSTDTKLQYVKMDGQAVFKFAVSEVPGSINKILEETNTKPEDVKYYLLHQANLRILQIVAKHLGISMDRFPTTMDHTGNISAASIPILLDEVCKKGMLQRGDKIVLSGFGGGFTWGSCLMEW
ncbi:MAG: ketoacyl-ACP synthase III [Lachnospiraceae bacterium]|nr:ketoacyl-ACP synthase III [Lachnospiraceae bacterium]